MEQDNRVIDDIAATKIKLLLEAERNAANAMPPGLASNNSGGSTLANLLNPSLFRGGPAARGMAGRVLRPAIEAEDSLLNRTMSGPGQVARNLGGSVLAGLLGMPGDLNAMLPKPLQGALPLPTSEQLQDKFGIEANRPESFVGLVGAPDATDIGRALPLLGARSAPKALDEMRRRLDSQLISHSKTLTPAENKFFAEMFENSAHKRELQEIGVSVKDGVLTVQNRASASKLNDYIDETVRLDAGQGSSRLPPSFYKGDFVEKMVTRL